MSKELLRVVDDHRKLYRDPKTGIAWVEDTSAGIGISCHPNIDARASVRAMKTQHMWRPNDRIVRSHGFAYNIDHLSGSGPMYDLARKACRCGADHGTDGHLIGEKDRDRVGCLDCGAPAYWCHYQRHKIPGNGWSVSFENYCKAHATKRGYLKGPKKAVAKRTGAVKK